MIGKKLTHLAIIMDGNGRWAQLRGKKRTEGHREGVKRIKEVIEISEEVNISFLTLYAFSTENWTRPKDEVNYLLRLPIQFLKEYRNDLPNGNVRIRMMGRRSGLPLDTLSAIDELEQMTADKTGTQVVFAFNYGGRAEIVDACKHIVNKAIRNEIDTEDLDENLFVDNIYLPDIPDVDLIIRTGGEQRLSNFLLWRSAYAELHFADVLWPDFSKTHLKAAIDSFSSRNRRFGRVCGR